VVRGAERETVFKGGRPTEERTRKEIRRLRRGERVSGENYLLSDSRHLKGRVKFRRRHKRPQPGKNTFNRGASSPEKKDPSRRAGLFKRKKQLDDAQKEKNRLSGKAEMSLPGSVSRTQ